MKKSVQETDNAVDKHLFRRNNFSGQNICKCFYATIAVLIAVAFNVQAEKNSTDYQLDKTVNIVIVGDSTVQTYKPSDAKSG